MKFTVTEAPKQHMGGRTIAEMAGGQGSSFGAGALSVEAALKAPKAPTTVNQADKTKVRHNGTDTY